MRRDVMESAGLEVFAEIAIIIFFLTFAIIAARVLFARKGRFEDVKNLPLDDGTEVKP